MSRDVPHLERGIHGAYERRILVINSNTSKLVTANIQRLAQQRVRPGTEVRTLAAESGPESIEGRTDGLIAASATIQMISRHASDYDGFVIACYSDPGLYEARELTDRPVVGIAEASMLTACLLGDRFSVLSPLRRLRPVIRDLAVRYGLSTRLASVRTFQMSVLDAARNPAEAVAELLIAGQAAIDSDGADVLCLGGVVLAGLELDLRRALGVPVLDGLSCALQLVESLLAQDLCTSHLPGSQPPYAKSAIGLPADLARLYGSERVGGTT